MEMGAATGVNLQRMKQIKWDMCSKSQFMYSRLRYSKKLVKDQNISRFCFLFSFQMIKINISFN